MGDCQRIFPVDSYPEKTYLIHQIMKAVFIGKGMYRITVRSKAKRERLARIPGVRVEGTRVIFPEWLSGNIRLILNTGTKRKTRKAIQTSLF